MNRMKWILLLVCALAPARVQAQGFPHWPGMSNPEGMNLAPLGPGMMRGVPPAGGMVIGPGVGPRPPFGPFPVGGPPPGGQGIQGFLQAQGMLKPPPPILPPQPPMPGNGPGGPDKDKDRYHGQIFIPPIRFIPPARLGESPAGEARGLGTIPEARPSFEAPRGLGAAGEGCSMGIGRSFAGVGAAIAGVGAAIAGFFRSLFGSGSKKNAKS